MNIDTNTVKKVTSSMSGFGASMLVGMLSANLTVGQHAGIKVLGWLGSVGLGTKANNVARDGMREFLDTLF